MVGETQMGKTSLGLRMLQKKHQQETSKYGKDITIWTVIDCKRTFWMGLESILDEDGHSCVIHPRYSDSSSVLQVLEKLRYLIQVLDHRQNYRWERNSRGEDCLPFQPRILLLEEWISFGKLAQAYDRAAKRNKVPLVWEEILDSVVTLLLNGLASDIHLWVFTQSPYMASNYFGDSGIRDQLAFWSLGSPIKGYAPIAKMLSPRYDYVVPDPDIRTELRKQLKNDFIDQGRWASFTTYSGEFALRETPYIDPQIQRTRLFYGSKPLHPPPPLGEPPPESMAKDEEAGGMPANVIQFPTQQAEPQWPQLSKAAQKLLAFTHREGGSIRLQQAQNGLGSRWGKKDVVQAAAQECANAGLGVLSPHPNGYPGSYLFETVEGDRSAAN